MHHGDGVQVQYKADCEQFYGRILDNSNVVSSVEGTCRRKTEEIWNNLYPEEPYALKLNKALSEDISDRISGLENCTKYDLVSAVTRQIPFFYQVIKTMTILSYYYNLMFRFYFVMLSIMNLNLEWILRLVIILII